MLLHRYSSIDYVNNLFWQDAINLINKALEKTAEQKDWDMWISIFPDMDKKTFVSFDEFRSKKKSRVTNTAATKLTKNEILEKAEELRKLHQGKHEGVK